jgi:two-component system, sensor histidine kinase
MAATEQVPVAGGDALLRERLKLLYEQSAGAVGSVFVGCALIAVILVPRAPLPQVTAWLSIFLIVNGYRVWNSRRMLRSGALLQGPADLKRFGWFAAINGLWTGALPLLFFDLLPTETRVGLTVMILLSVAGGVASFASHPTGYRVFVALALPPLALKWALYGESYWYASVTVVIYGLMMIRFSSYLASLFTHSVMIRFERELVVEALRQERAQSELERGRAEEANRAKSQFLANASHDLRQPAQALALYTAALQRNASTPEHRQIALSIAQASRALGELLDNLLDISRLDAGAVLVHREAVDLSSVVGQLKEEAARVGREKGLVVEAHCPRLMLQTDPVLLQRLLRNLLHNAVKFTDQGRVSIDVEVIGAEIRISVSDTGPGIPADQQQRIFEEFYQVDNPERDRAKGLGLGLSIVDRLAQLMGGRIAVSSQMGCGAVFSLSIPYESGESPADVESIEVPASAPDLRGRRLLIVEDDIMVRGALRDLLEAWGADVDACEGLSSALRHKPVWDLALCDLRLRNNEDGIATASALRTQRPGLPIVFITGDTAPERIEKASRTGHTLLHKPVSETQLAVELRTLLV